MNEENRPPPISPTTDLSALSIDEDRLADGDEVRIEINHHHDEHASLRAHPSSSLTNDSIPKRLKEFYSHRSFRQIVLSLISIMSIIFSFSGLFAGILPTCEAISFVTSVILLFAPSPLQLR